MPAKAEYVVEHAVDQPCFDGVVNSSDEKESEQDDFTRREEDEQCADVPS